MSENATAAALIAGETPTTDAMVAYWCDTDAGLRPKQETIAVLAALSAAPVTHERALAFVRYLDAAYSRIDLPASNKAVNIVGTGGGPSTFNISTTAAFVAAACGATVLKSSSPAYSSRVGSSDVLKQLGLSKASSEAALVDSLETLGIGFASASSYAPLCRRLAIAAMPLSFKMVGRFVNALGPLICPYRTKGAVVGASSPVLFDILRHVSAEVERPILAVHALCGIDELVSIGPICLSWPGTQEPVRLDPQDLGLPTGGIETLAGGGLEQNAALLQAVLKNEGSTEARATVALNAAAVLCISGEAQTLHDGLDQAQDVLQSGAAYQKLVDAQKRAEAQTGTGRHVV